MKKILSTLIIICLMTTFSIQNETLNTNEINNNIQLANNLTERSVTTTTGVKISQKSDYPITNSWLNPTYKDTNTGYLYVTGENVYGALGTGTNTTLTSYTRVIMSGDKEKPFVNPVDWNFGQYISSVIDTNGKLWTSGVTTSGSLGNGTFTRKDGAPGTSSRQYSFEMVESIGGKTNYKAVKVVSEQWAEGLSTMVMLDDGSIWVAGYGDSAGLTAADGGVTSSNSTPGSGNYYPSWIRIDTKFPSDDNKVKDFKYSRYSYSFLTTKENLYTVGDEDYQMNIGGESSYTIPKLTNVAQIGGGIYGILATTNDGELWTTGENFRGQLGLGFNGTEEGTVAPTTKLTKVDTSFLEEDEFIMQSELSQYASAILTNKGNLYMAGSRYTMGIGITSTSTEISNSYTTFTKVHDDVVYFAILRDGIYIMYSNGNMVGVGTNTAGMLGGDSNYDANSPEAGVNPPKGNSDVEEGEGLTPGISLPTYIPNTENWPKDKVEELTKNELDELTEQVKPAQPGTTQTGSGAGFEGEDGKDYIFSAPSLINSGTKEVQNTIKFNNVNFLQVNYNNLDLTSGALKGYSVQINIKNTNDNTIKFNNTFYYGVNEAEKNINNYPKAVGSYTVTASLLDDNYNVKATNTTTYTITNETLNIALKGTALEDYLNTVTFTTSSAVTVDAIKQNVLNGIRQGNFITSDSFKVVGVESDSIQNYIDGSLSNLALSSLTVKIRNENNTADATLTQAGGNFNLSVVISPEGYTSTEILIPFTLKSGSITVTHPTPTITVEGEVTTSITYGETYQVNLGDIFAPIGYTSTLRIIGDNGEIFEIPTTQLNNFDLYPKTVGNYNVYSIINDMNGNAASTTILSYKIINKVIENKVVYKTNEIINDALSDVVATGVPILDDLIRPNFINALSNVNNSINVGELINIVESNLYVEESDLTKYVTFTFYHISGYEIKEITTNGKYLVSFSIDIPNYTITQDTAKYEFEVVTFPKFEDNCVFFKFYGSNTTSINYTDLSAGATYSIHVEGYEQFIGQSHISVVIIFTHNETNEKIELRYINKGSLSSIASIFTNLPKVAGTYTTEVIVQDELFDYDYGVSTSTLTIEKGTLDFGNINIDSILGVISTDGTNALNGYLSTKIDSEIGYEIELDLLKVSNNSFVNDSLANNKNLLNIIFSSDNIIDTGIYTVMFIFEGNENNI